jgi:2-dehydro-3-deoxygluconokinase
MPRFVSVGEVIVELTGGVEAGYRFSLQGLALETALGIRPLLGRDWTVELFTALGDDPYSQRVVDGLAAADVGLDHVAKVVGRRIGLRIVEASGDDAVMTNWRAHAAARLMAEDPAAMVEAFADARVIHVSGAAFAILLPRARGRLMKALHRARQSGARIVLAPHEWPDQWTSRRIRGSSIDAIAMVADTVLTSSAEEKLTFGDSTVEAIAARYHDCGVEEVLIRADGQGIFLSSPAGGRWVGPESDGFDNAYLAARASGASAEDAVAAVSRKMASR